MADAYYGDGWSVAYRVHDAQFWGVPQRRKRIALVADFGGLAAPEILFEREGVSGDSEPGGETREEAAGGVGEGAPRAGAERTAGVSESVFCLQGNGIDRADTAGCNGAGWRENESYTLNTIDRPAVAYSITAAGFDGSMGAKAGNIGYEEEVSPTLNAGKEMHVASYGFEPGAARRLDPENRFNRELTPTLRAEMGDNQLGVAITEQRERESVTMRMREGCAGGGKGPLIQTEKSGTLGTGNDQTLFDFRRET